MQQLILVLFVILISVLNSVVVKQLNCEKIIKGWGN